MSVKDNFSEQSELYAAYRPHYPAMLFNYLFDNVKSFDCAWDCGTGNGQVAYQLARRFKKVYATDISTKQLDNAIKAPNIHYMQAPAEKTSIPSSSVDLVTVAQALHWFEVKSFYNEVKRVVKPGGILAYWGYNLLQVAKSIDPLIKNFHDNIVGSYWDPERKILLKEYADINFPLKDPHQTYFHYTVQWSLKHLKGYLESWSAVQHYIRQEHSNPVEPLIDQLQSHWRDNQVVTFPVFLILGRVG
ncbi:class I SAM-dependent methyltransferase [Fulvivirga kasyanovii]|uniref:Class I SAM-dependent methyltransferase n=1 Tax=Fulvivirga kasyanovii TaxID=396812 RepID=A0ABW9RLP7_9BACT|nr:class I SAM-dependent methyltransferase [Fulvivirga kasyanovii]MTI25014.1 class I SAM-dependent methyltransferase [Fulvivirga kasyanovii]